MKREEDLVKASRRLRIPFFPLEKSFPVEEGIEKVKRLQSLYGATTNTLDSWIPVQFVSTFPIFIHYALDSKDFWGFPEALCFKVLVSKEAYERFRGKFEMAGLLGRSDREPLPALKGNTKDAIFEYILKTKLWKLEEHFSGENIKTSLLREPQFKAALETLNKGYARVPLEGLRVSVTLKERLPRELCSKFKVLCFHEIENTLYVLMENPEQSKALEDTLNTLYRKKRPLRIFPCFASLREIERIRDSREMHEPQHFSGESGGGEKESKTTFFCDNYNVSELSEEKKLEDPHNLLAYILVSAIQLNASDIHIQKNGEEAHVRFRSNTLLSTQVKFEKTFLSKLNSVVSQFGAIDPFKNMYPHSGRFTAMSKGEKYEIRVSMMPMGESQSCVMRVHKSNTKIETLKTLGLNTKDRVILEDAISRNSGIVLITGPTGSGKSTTLYASLGALNKEEVSIETIEDPVERVMAGIKQFQVRYSEDEEKSLTFPRLFREVLRHDPDIIMVGEIRDLETAKQAVTAAQTGHLVFSTLHTQDALGAIPRLITEGVDPVHLADALILVVAQRLIGTICPECRIAIEMGSELGRSVVEAFERENIVFNRETPTFYRAGKCVNCNNTGFKGKQAIFEMLPITDGIREDIASAKSVHEIRKKADSLGLRSLYQEGLQQVALGKTTYEEAFKYRREFGYDPKALLESYQNKLKEAIA